METVNSYNYSIVTERRRMFALLWGGRAI